MLKRDNAPLADGDIRASRHAFLGVLFVTCLQIVTGMGVVWVKLNTTAWWFTYLIPAIVALAGFAHFKVLAAVTPRPLRKVGNAAAATLFSTYCMIFAVLNTFGS